MSLVRGCRRVLAGAALLAGIAGPGTPAHGAGAARPAARVLFQTTLAAGLAHHEAKAVWADLRPGDRLDLVREADNPHDRNAVRIEWQGRLLGYVPRADNEDIARQLDRGVALQGRIRAVAKYRNHRRKLELDVIAELRGDAAGGQGSVPDAR